MRRKRNDLPIALMAGVMAEMAKYYLGIKDHELLIQAIELNNESQNKILELENKIKELEGKK